VSFAGNPLRARPPHFAALLREPNTPSSLDRVETPDLRSAAENEILPPDRLRYCVLTAHIIKREALISLACLGYLGESSTTHGLGRTMLGIGAHPWRFWGVAATQVWVLSQVTSHTHPRWCIRLYADRCTWRAWWRWRCSRSRSRSRSRSVGLHRFHSHWHRGLPLILMPSGRAFTR
jgi:hypothetical protein